VVVITGGGTGLGKYMASGLFKNGAKVYIVGRRGGVLDDAVEEIQSELNPGEEGGSIVA
jgi:NAD(P)-dependent dehydrogenase (short-subunit alcohol dehydrogenase family)